ncbi:agamous-like MADS-box protein AGL62 [Nicotiana tomentosiformis]|uniref:Agamous-like MADS-box protein AGL62 n=1 Tax=Nicotiana tabacum TaxID=4097 RepID=A0A1S3Y104_TOBAC|nr:agamous-like MADS-box protein AGL62 [Nicotiana tomentosiformis]XP_016445672.1 PREDICTED: agamous-like MADS-box protein AGL62 [Nicotiana tabacum]
MSTRRIKLRKSVRLAKIENQNNRQVTFSKCRNGVFKKANELAVMTGAEVGIIVCPQGSKPYSFGHPNVNETINKYVGKERPPSPSGIDDNKLKKMNKNVESQQEWFKGPIEKMNYTKASMLNGGLEDLLLKVKNYGAEHGYSYENGKWKAE